MLSTNKTNELNEVTELTGNEYVVLQTESGPVKVKVSLLTGAPVQEPEAPTEP